MMKALIIEDETAAARNLAAILRQTAPDVEIAAPVIFTTAYDQYALEAFNRQSW